MKYSLDCINVRMRNMCVSSSLVKKWMSCSGLERGSLKHYQKAS